MRDDHNRSEPAEVLDAREDDSLNGQNREAE